MLLDVVESTLRDLQPDAPVAGRVALDDRLDRDLGLDSLARVEVLLRIERAYGIDLPEDTLKSAESVRDLLHAIERAAPKGARAMAASEAARGIEPALPEFARHAGGDAQEIEAPATARTLLEVLASHEQSHGDRTQITVLAEDHEDQITYRALATGAREVGAALQRAGLEPRQNVALMLPTAPEYFTCFFGILMAGGVPVPIYPPTGAAQLEEHVLRHAGILANAQTTLLITVTETKTVARLLQARVPKLRRIVTPQQLGAGSLRLAQGNDSGPHHPIAAALCLRGQTRVAHAVFRRTIPLAPGRAVRRTQAQCRRREPHDGIGDARQFVAGVPRGHVRRSARAAAVSPRRLPGRGERRCADRARHAARHAPGIAARQLVAAARRDRRRYRCTALTTAA